MSNKKKVGSTTKSKDCSGFTSSSIVHDLVRRFVDAVRRFLACLATTRQQEQQRSEQSKKENAKTTSTGTTVANDNNNNNVVQVYILLGQSNMLGMGAVHGRDRDGTLEHACYVKKLYPYLIVNGDNTDNNSDDASLPQWTTSTTVRNVRVMNGGKQGEMHVYHNEFMTVRGDTIGPELGIGHVLEQAAAAVAASDNPQQQQQQPIMLLKSCIGNRSLGWDLLPPGSPQYQYEDQIYAGYGDSPASWPANAPQPPPDPRWHAGIQYDMDIQNCKTVLADLDKYYPDATRYRVAGFFWWQGDKDRYDAAYSSRYELNLVRLIRQVQAEFDAPDAKFVLATLGQTAVETAKGTERQLLDAMMAVSDPEKHPDLEGQVATVYAHPLSKGGASNSHYNGNAETYMNVGQAMGQAMVDLTNGFAQPKTG